MSTLSLLDRAEARTEATTTAATAAQRLRTTMAAVRVSFCWFGVQKSLTAAQKAQAADATGESLGLIHHLGFSIVLDEPTDPHPEPLFLVIDCPHCGRAAPYPGQLRDGSQALAGCPDCDARFAFDVDAVYVTVRAGA